MLWIMYLGFPPDAINTAINLFEVATTQVSLLSGGSTQSIPVETFKKMKRHHPWCHALSLSLPPLHGTSSAMALCKRMATDIRASRIKMLQLQLFKQRCFCWQPALFYRHNPKLNLRILKIKARKLTLSTLIWLP